MTTDLFASLSLSEPILRALADEGYESPTEIQLAAIPKLLAGKDLMAAAQTGTGKTAAFALPMLEILSTRRPTRAKSIRALILTPTRELALQVEESLRTYGRYLQIRSTVLLGGVPAGPQIKALSKRPDIVVATPGRLLDLYSQGKLGFEGVEMLVLDEADRMLDMGFIRDVRRIVSKVPKARQTIFLSATMSIEVGRLASDMLRDPSMVSVTPTASISDSIAQKVLYVEQSDKLALLVHVLKQDSLSRTLVFTRTKHRADRVARRLATNGISAESIHSDKSQGARQKALAAFHRGKVNVLIATDIVARGIDVEGISHVVNYELPNDVESYVHRIGRTARAGADGTALSFCDFTEVATLRAIERQTGMPLTVIEDHPYHAPTLSMIGRSTTSRRRRARPRGRMGRRAAR